MRKLQEVTWTIKPTGTPAVIRNCKKCNTKKKFYSSGKFRLNGNHTRIDLWLIYKCEKCDATWKLTLKTGFRPEDMDRDVFDRFIHNDEALARAYAFDLDLLKRNDCEINYEVGYEVEGFDERIPEAPLLIHLKCPFRFELKLSTFLAHQLGISISGVKRLAAVGRIQTVPECDVMKHRIKADLDVLLR